MKNNRLAVMTVVLFVVALSIGIVSQAQDRMVNPVGTVRIRTNMVETPEFNVRNVSSSRGTKRWFEITTAYDIGVEWVDELEFVYYVYIETNIPDQRQMLWTHTVTYRDISRDRHMSKVYIHPDTYERFVDRVVYTGVEIRHAGRPIAWTTEEARRRDDQWWDEARRAFPPMEGNILHREDTPFGLINVDDFPARKNN